MASIRLERRLNSVGRRVFVVHLGEFSNERLTNAEVASRLRDAEGFTDKACRSRTTHARAILKSGKLRDALRSIVDSERLERSVREKAERLLSQLPQ
jgi:hypothetical protein